MNVTEANAANVVLRYLLHLATGYGDPPNADQLNQARGAAANLADQAHKRLSAGLTGRDVLQALPEYCADRFEDEGAVVRYCHRPAAHGSASLASQELHGMPIAGPHQDWHDDTDVVWPVEQAGAGGR